MSAAASWASARPPLRVSARPVTPTIRTTLAATATIRPACHTRGERRGSMSRCRRASNRSGGVDGVGGERQVGGHAVERGEGGAARPRSPGTCSSSSALGLDGVLAGQRTERVPGEQLLDLVVRRSAHSVSSSAARSLRIAANVLVFTVPSGMPQLLGDLHLGHASEVGHLEHLSLIVGEVAERLSDLFAPDDRGRPPRSRRPLRLRPPSGSRFAARLGPGPHALLAADRVDRPVVDQGQEEGPERRRGRGRRPRGHATWP